MVGVGPQFGFIFSVGDLQATAKPTEADPDDGHWPDMHRSREMDFRFRLRSDRPAHTPGEPARSVILIGPLPTRQSGSWRRLC
jgi:hypothetical protein